MHAVHAGPASPRSASAGEAAWHRAEFVETPAMRYVARSRSSMRWFYDMVDAESAAARTTAEPDRTPIHTFDYMVQQHSRASPALLYPPSSSSPPPPPPMPARRTSSAARALPRAPSWADDAPLGADVPMHDVRGDARPPRVRPADDAAAPEPRTLRFDPDHRLVSYAASEAPPRAEPTRKRPRHH